MPRRAETRLDTPALARLLGQQDGVVSRQQLLDLWASRADVRRLLARRELSAVHPGVYVDHTGQPTRGQREWAAVLVDRGRRVAAPEGVEVERVADWSTWVLGHRRPPRAKLEYALLKTASCRGEVEAIALLSDAVHQGLTTADRLLSVLGDLPRLPRRAPHPRCSRTSPRVRGRCSNRVASQASSAQCCALRGWTGEATHCGPGCTLDGGASDLA